MKNKKEIILMASIAVIAEKGYQESSIKDIADKAGISVGSVYSYFKNKQELLTEIYQYISIKQFATTDMLLKMEEYDAIHKLFATISAMVWSYAKEPELTLVLYVKSLGIDSSVEKAYFKIYDQAVKGVSDMVGAFQKMGLCNVSNADYAAIAFLKVLEGMVVQWIRNGQKRSAEEISAQIIEYNCNALRITFDLDEMQKFVKELFSEHIFDNFISRKEEKNYDKQ